MKKRDIRYFFKKYNELTTLIAFLGLYIVFYYINPLLNSWTSWSSLLLTASSVGLIAIFITLLLIAGEFDLSVGSVFVLGGMSFGILINMGINPLLALLITLLLSSLVGFINGIITVYLDVPSFMTTLGTSYALLGFILITTGGFPVAISPKTIPFYQLLAGDIYGINAWTLWFIFLGIVAYIILEHTSFGNHIFATGGSTVSAYAVGVNVKLVKLILFIATALFAGFDGVISLLYFTSISPVEGQTMPLLALAVAVIGGSKLTGGSGKIQGTMIAALIIGLLYVGLTLAKVPSYWYITFIGILLVIVALINQKLAKSKSL
ncbi:MAG: ABC transporter permease [Infirmifilum sp.]